MRDDLITRLAEILDQPSRGLNAVWPESEGDKCVQHMLSAAQELEKFAQEMHLQQGATGEKSRMNKSWEVFVPILPRSREKICRNFPLPFN